MGTRKIKMAWVLNFKKNTMSEDEVTEEEVTDLDEGVDFADDGIDLGDDDLVDDDAELGFSSNEIE